MECILIPFAICAGVVLYHWLNRVRVEDEEYLKVLSFDRWQSESEIRERVLEQKGGGSISSPEAIGALLRLERKRLVEKKFFDEDVCEGELTIPVLRFRLKPNSPRRKDRRTSASWWSIFKPAYST